jgi:membrane-bound ClpP family serine protease
VGHKDFALYPFFRKSYQGNVPTGSERLIGEIGTTKEWLGPEGYVQIHGQLWRAVAEPKSQPISPDTSVRVKDADGLTLTVTCENGASKNAAGQSATGPS